MNAGAKKKCVVTVHIWFLCHAPLSKRNGKSLQTPLNYLGLLHPPNYKTRYKRSLKGQSTKQRPVYFKCL